MSRSSEYYSHSPKFLRSLLIHRWLSKNPVQFKSILNCSILLYSVILLHSCFWFDNRSLLDNWWIDDGNFRSSNWQLSILVHRQGKLPRGSVRVRDYWNSWIIIRFFHSWDRISRPLSNHFSHTERQPIIWPIISDWRTNAIESVAVLRHAYY